MSPWVHNLQETTWAAKMKNGTELEGMEGASSEACPREHILNARSNTRVSWEALTASLTPFARAFAAEVQIVGLPLLTNDESAAIHLSGAVDFIAMDCETVGTNSGSACHRLVIRLYECKATARPLASHYLQVLIVVFECSHSVLAG